MRVDVEENLDIESRKCNLIFHGVKEMDEGGEDSEVDNDSHCADHQDRHMLEEILRVGMKLDASRHIEAVSRIGKFVERKLRPIKVKVKSLESKSEILKRAKQLKENNSFKKVFISPDLTRKQQIVDKDLRDQVKKFREDGHDNVRIKSGKVI